MNKFICTGRLSQEPSLRSLPNGTSVCDGSIAVDKIEKGERQADFFNYVAYGKQAEFISTYLHKGYLVAIVGRFNSRKYVDQQGTNRVIYEIIIESIDNLTPKQEAQPQPQQQVYQQPAPQPQYRPQPQPTYQQPAPQPQPQQDIFGNNVEDSDTLPWL